MKNSILADWLKEKPCLMADGATGTNLFAAGLLSGDSPEFWNIEHPDRIVAHHQAFLRSGADILLTNTFGGTRHRLKLHNGQDRVAEINIAAARLARKAADSTGRRVLIAGSIGPTGELFAPLGPLTHESGKEAFLEQAQALKEGGVDLLWIETMSARDEIAAAADAAQETGLPFVTTCSFDTNGRTMMGLTPAEFAQFVHTFPVPPVAYGANCGVGASELVVSVLEMAKAAQAGDILIAKGNCGVPYYEDGKVKYNGTPELMADYARLVLNAGARIIGGCCGTSYEHLASIRRALDNAPKGEAPSIEDITSKLGDLSLGTKAALSGQTTARRPRRRDSTNTPSF